MADIYVDCRAHRVLVEMVLSIDAEGDYATIAEENSGIAHSAIPTPAALIPSRLFVYPFFERDAVALFSSLAEGRADSAQHFLLGHPNRDARGRLRCGSTGAEDDGRGES